MKASRLALIVGFGFSALIFFAQRAEATLGGFVDSVESDRKALSAVRGSLETRGNYTVHEIYYDAISVREYVSRAGVVFAVTWNGLIHPDLTELLGTYNGDYEEALRRTPRGRDRRQIEVRASRVVVEKWGHMRNLQGRAYAPDLVPPGVNIDEIR